ncbi:MAG TPA: phenylalanine--tRNA ligase beta subunit-related protein [Candidatus Methylomirabilis sp.]|nr:phenylalanine--tRNA ligase beta subunit-related protein [Candidatus Methylomirabilis sp.]
MLSISATAEWRAAHPGAAIGLLELSGVENARGSFQLDDRKRQTEARLCERYRGFTRQDFLALPAMAAYAQYYKRFGKTYHVLLQLESIVHKGKGLPNVSPLVDANFTAEVETLVLTAGHDVGKLHGEISIDTARDGDQLAQMTGGPPKAIPAGDMIMRDAEGVCCSIIYGQDNRSPISAATSHVLYVAYAPAGVPRETVEAHLRLIEEHARLVSPLAVTEQQRSLT